MHSIAITVIMCYKTNTSSDPNRICAAIVKSPF